MSGSVFEDRRRAAKAWRIAAVLGRLIASSPDVTLEDVEAADEVFRARVAVLAKCKPPSERTWAVALQLCAERANPPADPFDGLT